MSAVTMNQNVQRSRFRRACSKVKSVLTGRKTETAQPALTAAALALHAMDSKLVKDEASCSTDFGSEKSLSTIETDSSSIGRKSVRFSVDIEDIMEIATRKAIQEENDRFRKEAMAAAMKRRAVHAKNNGCHKARDSLSLAKFATF